MEHNKCSAVTWLTVHEHIVADARLALRRVLHRYLFMNSKHHKSTTREIYVRTQAVCAKRLNVDDLHTLLVF